MPVIEYFDAVFLGGGAAAKNLAPYLARSGEHGFPAELGPMSTHLTDSIKGPLVV